MTDSQIILLAGVIIPLMGSLLIEWVMEKLEKKRMLPHRRQPETGADARKVHDK